MQANRKTHEGADHPDRDGQFRRIAEVSSAVLASGGPRSYTTKIQITDQQMQAVNIQQEKFHPEWNYTITPSVIKT